MKKIDIFFSLFIIYLIICIILSPSKFISSMLDGISVWTFNVLPSILPFMILTSTLLGLGFLERISKPFARPFSKIYRTSSNSGEIFLLSILSGYPIGSKMIAELYENGKISQNDAFKMSSFCSNSGPMFIIGSVGVGMLFCKTAGYILFLSHVFSALLNGLIYRNLKFPEHYLSQGSVEKKSLTFSDIISSSISGILNIAVIISLFFVITTGLSPLLSPLSPSASSFIKGILEMTQGCLSISKNFSLKWSVPLCSFLISFGGISTICQSTIFLKKVNMPLWLFTLQKITQGIIALLISILLTRIFL